MTPDPLQITIELHGPGARHGERHTVAAAFLRTGLTLIEYDPPLDPLTEWWDNPRDLTLAQVSWQWDGRPPVDGIYRFDRR